MSELPARPPCLTRPLCLIRGGGDLATGVAWRLSRSGFPVVVTELAQPLAVRRTVCLSSAVDDGMVDIEGLVGRLTQSYGEAVEVAAGGEVAVLVSTDLPGGETPEHRASIVIDARLAKRNIDTSPDDADLVIALGPGFEAGRDCHAVVETKRGSRLGRTLWTGSAAPNTGVPGIVDGRGAERVLRAPLEGQVQWHCAIGDTVKENQVLGRVSGSGVLAPFDGLIRGLIRNEQEVAAGYKIGDVDPRSDAAYDQISDKALAIGGGVLEAVLTWQNRIVIERGNRTREH